MDSFILLLLFGCKKFHIRNTRNADDDGYLVILLNEIYFNVVRGGERGMNNVDGNWGYLGVIGSLEKIFKEIFIVRVVRVELASIIRDNSI